MKTLVAKFALIGVLGASLMGCANLDRQQRNTAAGAVIGGYGNIYGAIIGSLFIGLLETFVGAYVSTVYKEFIVYGVMILFMIFRPTGIMNAKVYSI